MTPAPNGRPQVLLTFTLHDGTQRSTICDYLEALRQLKEAKEMRSLWADFTIGPVVICEFCKEPALSPTHEDIGRGGYICFTAMDRPGSRACTSCNARPSIKDNDTGLCSVCESKETLS